MHYVINEEVLVYYKINENNLKGWIKGVIEIKKGDFYLVNLSNSELSTSNKNVKVIFHKAYVRKYDE